MAGEKPLVWMEGEVKTPPFSTEARLQAGFLLRQLQAGESLGMPRSRPMPTIDTSCHELRIPDQEMDWRLVYSIEPEAIVILDVFAKKTRRTPKRVLESCARRLAVYRHATGGRE